MADAEAKRDAELIEREKVAAKERSKKMLEVTILYQVGTPYTLICTHTP